MKRVITYGTFDLFHVGHENLLRRAKELGDYLIVGVTTENYDKERGKLNVHRSLMQRIEAVKATGFADEIIIEEYEGQKIDDILKHNVDVFAIGSDWTGKFDYLKEYCEVVYLDRTKGISSTSLRSEIDSIIELGIIGTGRIANRFIVESKYISGAYVKGVYNPRIQSATAFCEKNELEFSTDDINVFLDKVSAVYIASPHITHAGYIRMCLEKGKHVLCEKPLVLTRAEAVELYALAKEKKLVLKEAIKTAYAPAFNHLMAMIKSGTIGTVKDVDASFSKLCNAGLRELKAEEMGGSMTELGSYVLLPIVKLLGKDYKDINFYSFVKDGVDLYTRGVLVYENGVASFKVGLGVKTEGELIISGTKGYAYVPAPWWKTDYFELRYEDSNQTKKYFYKFDGDGLRYELNDFISQINNRDENNNHKLLNDESVFIVSVIEDFLKKRNVTVIQ
ncbi:glycerol-3-phosphate cytidylyltransferase [Paludibacter sp. 221]|uniref:Gfo/Idh/MocA family oxidoreductase n=1 Tax=Paludibacter sp. 221 TaxID=2302939 RepID=UPI0013D187DD|nr:Gfo/Idh/MocA family oxidoreductase [Paludibacter sp. 221]NDV46716.1 glycerol-3-phosphate cytidylyltransferase [Paludibacter sp. 221]